MRTIKYVSKTGRTWEYQEGKWYCEIKNKRKEIPRATFYELGGDREKLIKYKRGKIKAENFLFNIDKVEDALCPTGHIYLVAKINGKKKIMRTKEEV